MVEAPCCPETGAPMTRGTRPRTIAYKGHQMTVEMPGWYSDRSDASIFTREDMRVSDRALATLKAQILNLASPDEVSNFRKTFGLTQAEAGRVLGGGVRAFQKYESGEVTTSRSMTNLLRLVSRHPEELPHMAAQAKGDEANLQEG